MRLNMKLARSSDGLAISLVYVDGVLGVRPPRVVTDIVVKG